MRLRTASLLVLGLLWYPCLVPAGEVQTQSAEQVATLDNDFIKLTLDWSTGSPRLASIVDKLGAAPSLSDQGFVLHVGKGQTITAEQCRVLDAKTDCQSDGTRQVVLRLRHDASNLELRLAYTLAANDFFARKTLAVRDPSEENAMTLYRAEIERLQTDATLALGGQGQPVFVGGRLFLGLEYPAGQNQVNEDRVCLAHFPGKQLGRDWLELKTEVIGVAGRRSVEDAFAEYVRRIRVPPRSWVLYNSWYDIRRPEMSNEVFIECFDDFRRLLIDKYGVKLDSFVVDDGYQDRQSIWKTDLSVVPGDFGKLADYLRKHGSRFGIWMPLTAPAPYLDVDWGKAQGYEVVDSGTRYCISGPKYRADLKRAIARHIEQFGLNYYKHDFNSFGCAAAGHGHLPESVYGFESNVDAYIETLQYARQLNPDIFLNVTGGMWLSPWWLMYADTVWRGGGDTGHEGIVPYIERRDDSMTYVDGVIWDRVVKRQIQFPTSALMTHGIIYGRRAMLGGKDEPLHRWADHVVAYHAPGLMMKELYITPSILTEGQWSVLGPTLAWAVAEQEILAVSKMTHGNPHAGEVYGYLHAMDGRLIWFLRNPSMNPQVVELDVAGAIGGRPTCIAVTYPYRESLSCEGPVSVEVGPYQTMVIEASQTGPTDRVVVSGCRHAVVSRGGRVLTCDLIGEPGAKASVHVESPVAIHVATLDGLTLSGVAPNGIESKHTSFDVQFPGKSEPAVTMDRITVNETGNRNRVALRIADGATEAVFAVLCEEVGQSVPMGGFQLNGKPVRPKIVSGDGWRLFLVSLDCGSAEVSWEVPLSERATQAFAPTEMTVSSWVLLRRELAARRLVLSLAADAPALKELPTPLANVEPVCVAVQPRRVLRTVMPGDAAPLSAGQLAAIKAAKLRVKVFDVNGGPQYGHKPILLNGQEIGILPANTRRAWEEKILDIPPDKLRLVRAENTLVLTNPTHDPFKVTDVGLALQLADGTWVHTNRDLTIHCSVRGGWLYAEGQPFDGDRSAPIRLAIP